MSENFLRFKKRLAAFRIIKSAMIGGAVGAALSGIWLVLTRLAILDLEPVIALFIGIGSAFAVALLTCLLSRRSDKSLAEELDDKFDLNARVQTLVAYSDAEGDMIDLLREDTDRLLSEVPSKAYKFKGLAIYIAILVVSAAVLVAGFTVPDMRGYTPPVEEAPFELTAEMEMEMKDLIRQIEGIGTEEEFLRPIINEIYDLIAVLKETKTQKAAMSAADKSMAVIKDITYESSTSTEMLNALWKSNDIYFRYLAKDVLYVRSGESLEWGDFAERMIETYVAVLMGDNDKSDDAVIGTDRLKAAIDGMAFQLEFVLASSGLPEDDEMYLAIKNFIEDEEYGLEIFLDSIDGLTDDEARSQLVSRLNSMGKQVYAAVMLNKNNAASGEKAMWSLGSILGVNVPEFETPDFIKSNESIGGVGSSEKDDESSNTQPGGGAGEGATYGSDDLVLDYLTGELVKYGELIDRYNEIIYGKLDGEFYTEEQKEAIRKYLMLLYSGFEKKEGN